MKNKHIYKNQSNQNITIQDVARLSGTSPSTVSRVLTGNVPVASAKREAILRVIAEYNYRPNLIARSLKTRETHSLGLLINDIMNPYYGALALGIGDRASELGYGVMLCNTNEDPERELGDLRMLRDKAIDGIILAPSGSNTDVLNELLTSGMSLVQVDRRLPGLRTSAVILDNVHGGYLATRHLLDQGHTHIGLVTYSLGQMTVAEREEGYLKALNEAGIAAKREDICRVSFARGDMPRLVSQMLTTGDRPTALVAANNRIALAVLRCIKDLSLIIPDDLALVAFDDLDLYDLLNPSITAIAQPAYAMGRKAASLLLEQLGESGPESIETCVFQPELILRGSSGPHRQ